MFCSIWYESRFGEVFEREFIDIGVIFYFAYFFYFLSFFSAGLSDLVFDFLWSDAFSSELEWINSSLDLLIEMAEVSITYSAVNSVFLFSSYSYICLKASSISFLFSLILFYFGILNDVSSFSSPYGR